LRLAFLLRDHGRLGVWNAKLHDREGKINTAGIETAGQS